MKYFEKVKLIPSDLSSRGNPVSNQDSNLEFELELELNGPKPKGSRTFPPRSLSMVRSGRRGKIFHSFLIVLKYSTDSSQGLSLQEVSSQGQWDSPSSPEASTTPSPNVSLSPPLEDISPRLGVKNR